MIPHFPCSNSKSNEVLSTSTAIQVSPEMLNKPVQCALGQKLVITSLWDTEDKLNTMTGIPSFKLLETLVNICINIKANDNCIMSMKDRILLTMHLLKSNCSLAVLAINFQITEKTAKCYFSETIQLLASFLIKCIYWQSDEENKRSIPVCFKNFNVQTVLDCTEIKIPSFRCLKCRTSTYSHYKGTHTVKILLGVAPSGLINHISPAVGGRSSDF